jgi:hypothetical protein
MRYLPVIILLSFAACAPEPPTPPETTKTAPPPSPEPSPQPPTLAQPDPEPPPAPRPEITIKAPPELTTNPIPVTGEARTFENNVVVRLRDARGALMSERYTTARGDMGHHNPYSIDLFVTRDPGPRVTLEALEYSAKDGSERSLAKLTRPFSVPLVDATLYVGGGNDCDVKPRQVRIPKSIAAARLLAEALLAAQTALFPKGTEIRTVNLRDGVLTIDFNEAMQNAGGSCRARALRASIEKTLGGLAGVRQVVITAAGSRELALQP